MTPREPAPSPTSRPEGGADAIEISPQGRRVVEFPKDARARADLVAKLRQEVDAGTYRPDADAVARLLAERIDH